MFPSNLSCTGSGQDNCSRPYSLVADRLAKANDLFQQVWMKGNLFRFWARLMRREATLVDLSTLAFNSIWTNSHPLGVRSIPLDRIHGSENRSGDFDAKFYPTHYEDRQRWVNIAKLRLLHVDLQAVSLIQVGENYFVRDGHHRISVARALGAKYIDADVIQWQKQAEGIPFELSAIPCSCPVYQ